MGIRTTESDPKVALYDSVSGFAFGPTFDTSEEAENFLEWSRDRSPDLRTLTDPEISKLHSLWFDEYHREDEWAKISLIGGTLVESPMMDEYELEDE